MKITTFNFFYVALLCTLNSAHAHDNFISAIAHAKPSMVKISAYKNHSRRSDKKQEKRNQALGNYADFFKKNFEKTAPLRHASGFIIHSNSERSLILTASHVVLDSSKIWVTTQKGKKVKAKILHYDRKNDVALLIVLKGNLPTLTFNKAPLQEGQYVLGMGAAFGLSTSSSLGIVSALDVKLTKSSAKLIQTDVSVNPGSSGGALIDPEGNAVGLITKIVSDTGTFSGLSFAAPISSIEKLLVKWNVSLNEILPTPILK